MKKSNHKGFTLSETLITLSIVGILAVLVIPGLIKDSINRAMVSTLKSTVANLNDAIENEIINKRALNMEDTDLYKAPDKFLKNFDISEIAINNKANSLFAGSYKTISGNSSNITKMKASATLKNGVVIGIPESYDPESKSRGIYIDTNGKKGPNIYGVDCFIVYIINKSDTAKGFHAGDVGCATLYSTRIEACKTTGANCYCALERTGFDPKYLEYTDVY